MRYRNMKTGEERDFIEGMKINDLWKPVQTLHTGGRSTVKITEIHPEDLKPDMSKTILGEDKSPEKPSRRKSAMAKAVGAANRKLAKRLKTEESI